MKVKRPIWASQPGLEHVLDLPWIVLNYPITLVMACQMPSLRHSKDHSCKANCQPRSKVMTDVSLNLAIQTYTKAFMQEAVLAF